MMIIFSSVRNLHIIFPGIPKGQTWIFNIRRDGYGLIFRINRHGLKSLEQIDGEMRNCLWSSVCSILVRTAMGLGMETKPCNVNKEKEMVKQTEIRKICY
jgi:hypothetical protein